VHPGHFANYSEGCGHFEARPPTRRRKCGAFTFDASFGSPRVHPVKLAADPNNASPRYGSSLAQGHTDAAARLSYRLKTFTSEPEFDRPWLEALQTASRLPDVLLLSAGIWDMQYPPGEDATRGARAFKHALRHFLTALDGALRHATSLNRALQRPRLFWLTVTAVSDAKLPAWKRPRMNVEIAREYNKLAAPELERAGILTIDTFTSGALHPELSADGVHFPGPVSQYHSQLFWDAICQPRPSSTDPRI
jgi:hypothetical protein